MTILVTGAAGFIGHSVARRLLEAGHAVVGLDNLNPYYDVRLKQARLAQLTAFPNFIEARLDLENTDAIRDLFDTHKPRIVIHLAAQAGVRYSVESPRSYVDSNLVGLTNILEGCRQVKCEHLLFASSSSVYGLNRKLPFAVADAVDHPISFYAATKRAGELMVHTYSHLFAIPSTCLRFFTVYGPWGRPDMALFLFAEAIRNDRPIKVFNNGDMRRAFTYIDDVVEAVIRLMDRRPAPLAAQNEASPAESLTAPFRILNVGSEESVPLLRYIDLIEQALGKTATKQLLPIQPGDVTDTWADTRELKALIGWQPTTGVEIGVQKFISWYLDFYARADR